MEEETFGEICVRGPQVMLGHLCKSHSETDQLQEGWLLTGNSIGSLIRSHYVNYTQRLTNYRKIGFLQVILLVHQLGHIT